MNIENWKEQTEELLSELRKIDFGYPLGDNLILDPTSDDQFLERIEKRLGSQVATSLRYFYQICDGLSWPDVQSGYFIKESALLGVVKDQFEVTQVNGRFDCDVVVIGSTGNGILFAIDPKERVLRIPTGKIENNTYIDSDGKVSVLSNRFLDFVYLLTNDLKAFVEDTQDYKYIG